MSLGGRSPVHDNARGLRELEIVDDGRGEGARNGACGGHGLVGMRERAALYGGELEVGPQDGGGFVVRARLPVGVEGA